jgi:outer membrane protein assembly factor BamD
MKLRALLLAPVLFLAACAVGGGLHGHPQTVEGLYKVACDDMESGLYPEALKEFAEIKVKFPYSRFAALSDLRTADTHFKRGKFIEAVDAYRNFLRFHPNHEDAGYALFRIGESYYEQIPGDWWFLPPGAEKDQGSTRQAIVAYEDLLSRYGQGTMSDEARGHLDACRRKLADHEMYVARFYFKNEHWAGAAARASVVLREYSGLGLDPDALWIVGRSNVGLGDKVAATDALERLVKEFPTYKTADEAKAFLQNLHSEADHKT